MDILLHHILVVTFDWATLWCHTTIARQHNTSLALFLCSQPLNSLYNNHKSPQTITHSYSNHITSLLVELHKNWDEPFAHRTKCTSDPKEPTLLISNHCWGVNHSTLILCTNSNRALRKLHPKWWGETWRSLVLFYFHFILFLFSFISKYINMIHLFYSTYMKFGTLSKYNNKDSIMIIKITQLFRHVFMSLDPFV